MELTFIATAMTKPRTKMMICVRRLYQPETRSMALLNQDSMPLRKVSRSLLALLKRVRSADLTCGFWILTMELRVSSAEGMAPLSGPRMAATAVAKFLEGMYEGRVLFFSASS